MGCVVSSSESSRILEKYGSSRQLARRRMQESYSTRVAIVRVGGTNICRPPNLPGGDLNCIHVNRPSLKDGGQNKCTLQVGHAPVQTFFDQCRTASSLKSVSKIQEQMLEEDAKTSDSMGRRQESQRSPCTESVDLTMTALRSLAYL